VKFARSAQTRRRTTACDPRTERQPLEGRKGEVGPLRRELSPGHEPTQHLKDLQVEQLERVQPAGTSQPRLDRRLPCLALAADQARHARAQAHRRMVMQLVEPHPEGDRGALRPADQEGIDVLDTRIRSPRCGSSSSNASTAMRASSRASAA
jgi:hypothetical protein